MMKLMFLPKKNSRRNIPGFFFYSALVIMLAVPLLAVFTVFILMQSRGFSFSASYHFLLIEAALIAAASVVIIILMKKTREETLQRALEKEKAETALRESEELLGDLIDFLPDATFVIDRNRKVVIWNKAIEELSGIKAKNILGKGDYEYALPFHRKRRPLLIDLCTESNNVIARYYSSFKKSGTRLTAEFFVPGTARNGAHLWAIAQPLYDRDGALIGAIESMRDVTERREAEEKFASAFKLSPFVLSISSAEDGRYLEVSDSFYTISGYTREEVIGHTAFEINIWADTKDRERIMKMLREKGHVHNEELLFRAKNGEIRTMLFSAEIVVITGKPCLLAVNVDITERKQQQEIIKRQNEELLASNEEFEAMNEELIKSQKELIIAHQLLQQSEQKLSTSFHLAPVIMTLSTIPDGQYVEVSDHFLNMTGYTRDEVIGQTALELGIWADTDDRERMFQKIRKQGSIIDEEVRFKSKDGVHHLMLFSAEIVSIFNIPHLLSIATDITERKRAEREKMLLEEQLRQSQKMESIGRLAGGIAHDFNNLLTAILGNTDFAINHIERGEDAIARLEIVKKAAKSAAQLTRHLLTFSRKEIIEPRVIDLNQMIEHIHSMLARLIGEDIKLKIETGASGCIRADPGQIEQIIMNLVVNARDAMPGGGTIIIKTEETYLDNDYCKKHAGASAGDHVMLSLSDTGHGMTEETKKNLFEPFFTTKAKGKGTGLGLAMVYGAVRQNNGMIEVYSEPGQGTTFKLYFPAEHEKAGEQPAVHETGDMPGGTETILMVEDDDMVRDYAEQVLSRLGYRVTSAPSGEDALTVVRNSEHGFDLLLTDIILTGMNGKALAGEIASVIPGIKVLFTSGYTEDIIAERGILEKGINFIGKPYTAAALAAKVRETLDS